MLKFNVRKVGGSVMLAVPPAGACPVLIVSPEAFNRSGLCVICPITQGGNQARFAGFAMSLTGTVCQTLENHKTTFVASTWAPRPSIRSTTVQT